MSFISRRVCITFHLPAATHCHRLPMCSIARQLCITALCVIGAGACALAGGCAESAPGTPHQVSPPASAPAAGAENAWPEIAKILGRAGVLKGDVYAVTVPRDDLDVTLDGMGIPTAAGIESVFYFYRCPCGKLNVAGQFVATDYESNDVVDALRQNAAMKVATVTPLFLYDKPRLLLIRFQGEGEPAAMAKVLREALRWTGKERMAPTSPVGAEPLTTEPTPK